MITNTVTINLVANAIAVGGSAAMVYLPMRPSSCPGRGATYLNVGTIFPVYEESLPRAARALRGQQAMGPGPGGHRHRFASHRAAASVQGTKAEHHQGQSLGDPGPGRTVGIGGRDQGFERSRSGLHRYRDGRQGCRRRAGEVDRRGGGRFRRDGPGDGWFRGRAILWRLPLHEQDNGSGCALGGVMAVYAAVASPFIAALTGHAVFNLAASRAERRAEGPGSFQTFFLDELYNATAEEIANNPFELEEVGE